VRVRVYMCVYVCMRVRVCEANLRTGPHSQYTLNKTAKS